MTVNVWYAAVAPANASLNRYRIGRHNGVPSHRRQYSETPADADDGSAGYDADRIALRRAHHSLVARSDRATPCDLCCCRRCRRSGYCVEVEEVDAFSASRSVWRSPNGIVTVVEHDDVPINLKSHNLSLF